MGPVSYILHHGSWVFVFPSLPNRGASRLVRLMGEERSARGQGLLKVEIKDKAKGEIKMLRKNNCKDPSNSVPDLHAKVQSIQTNTPFL